MLFGGTYVHVTFRFVIRFVLWNTKYIISFLVLSLDDSEVLKSVVHAYHGKEIEAKFVASMRGWNSQQMAD